MKSRKNARMKFITKRHQEKTVMTDGKENMKKSQEGMTQWKA